MKSYLCFFFLAILVLACAQEKKVDLNKPVDIKRGEEIFNINCVLCHGPEGDLEVNGAKDLGLSILPVEERIVLITNGRNQMMSFKGLLDEGKIRDVAHYSLKFNNESNKD